MSEKISPASEAKASEQTLHGESGQCSIGGLTALRPGDTPNLPRNTPDIAQRMAIQSAANNSAQVRQLKALQTAINQSPVQRKAEPDPQGGLPSQLRAGIEHLSGTSMDGVNVHYNSSKPAQMQAHAYAQGSDIHIAPGQEQQLPHEAWHVAQQRQGRVQATTSVAGAPVNDNPTLEAEADTMGAKAMQLKLASSSPTLKSIGSSSTVQQHKSAGSVMQLKGQRIERGSNTGWGTFGWTDGAVGQQLWTDIERKFNTELDPLLDSLEDYEERFPGEANLQTIIDTINGYMAAKSGPVQYARAATMNETLDRLIARGNAAITAIQDEIDTAKDGWRTTVARSAGLATTWSQLPQNVRPDLDARRDAKNALRDEINPLTHDTATRAEITRIDALAATVTTNNTNDTTEVALINLVLSSAQNRDRNRLHGNLSALRAEATDAQIKTLLGSGGGEYNYTTEAAIQILNLAFADKLIVLLAAGETKANILALYTAMGMNKDDALKALWDEIEDGEAQALVELIQLAAAPEDPAGLLSLLQGALSTHRILELMRLAGQNNEASLVQLLGWYSDAEVEGILDTQSGRQNGAEAHTIAGATADAAEATTLMATQGVRGSAADVVALLAHATIGNNVAHAEALLNKRGTGTDALTLLNLGATRLEAEALLNTTGIRGFAAAHMANLWNIAGIGNANLVNLLNLKNARELDEIFTAHAGDRASARTRILNGHAIWAGDTIAAGSVHMTDPGGADVTFSVVRFQAIQAQSSPSIGGAHPGTRYAGNRPFGNALGDATITMLPRNVTYTEYDIHPFANPRDPHRIVEDQNGVCYYSNHYNGQRRIV